MPKNAEIQNLCFSKQHFTIWEIYYSSWNQCLKRVQTTWSISWINLYYYPTLNSKLAELFLSDFLCVMFFCPFFITSTGRNLACPCARRSILYSSCKYGMLVFPNDILQNSTFETDHYILFPLIPEYSSLASLSSYAQVKMYILGLSQQICTLWHTLQEIRLFCSKKIQIPIYSICMIKNLIQFVLK